MYSHEDVYPLVFNMTKGFHEPLAQTQPKEIESLFVSLGPPLLLSFAHIIFQSTMLLGDIMYKHVCVFTMNLCHEKVVMLKNVILNVSRETIKHISYVSE